MGHSHWDILNKRRKLFEKWGLLQRKPVIGTVVPIQVDHISSTINPGAESPSTSIEDGYSSPSYYPSPTSQFSPVSLTFSTKPSAKLLKRSRSLKSISDKITGKDRDSSREFRREKLGRIDTLGPGDITRNRSEPLKRPFTHFFLPSSHSRKGSLSAEQVSPSSPPSTTEKKLPLLRRAISSASLRRSTAVELVSPECEAPPVPQIPPSVQCSLHTSSAFGKRSQKPLKRTGSLPKSSRHPRPSTSPQSPNPSSSPRSSTQNQRYRKRASSLPRRSNAGGSPAVESPTWDFLESAFFPLPRLPPDVQQKDPNEWKRRRTQSGKDATLPELPNSAEMVRAGRLRGQNNQFPTTPWQGPPGKF